jgi:hypothetical protein
MTDGPEAACVPARADEKDELSGEVALRAHIDKSGLTLAGKSRALAATDRLLGGLIGIPGQYLEGRRSKAAMKDAIEVERLRAEGNHAIELLKIKSEFARMAARRFIAEELQKQVNREAVWLEMDTEISALLPLDGEDPGDKCCELDNDWTNIFVGYAEKASSERLRQLWGRILAGEIRKPGSFALSTLRIISEMDAEIATAFQEIVALRFGPDTVLPPTEMKNDILNKWVFLEEVGLLQGVLSNLNISLSPEADTLDDKSSTDTILLGEYYLKVWFRNKAQIIFRYVRITRVGQQLAAILPLNELESLAELAERIRWQSDGVEIGRLIAKNESFSQPNTTEIIRTYDRGPPPTPFHV